jgi:hypothetical protein
MRKVIPSLALLLLLGVLLVQVGCSSDDEPTTTPQQACSPITMETPRLGDSFFSSDEINIRWKLGKTTGDSVMVELFKGDSSVGVITPSTSNSGYYPWLKPTTFGEDSDEEFSQSAVDFFSLQVAARRHKNTPTRVEADLSFRNRK